MIYKFIILIIDYQITEDRIQSKFIFNRVRAQIFYELKR